MDRRAAIEFADAKLGEYGLAEQGWRFVFDERPRARLGQCRHCYHTISVTGWYCDQNDPSLVRDTILHELAHALAGPTAKHGSKWKEWCLKVGANPQRCKPISQVSGPTPNYISKCTKCSTEYKRQRKPKRGAYCPCTRLLDDARPLLEWVYCGQGAVKRNETQVDMLLQSLASANDSREQKRIRAQLRRLGHRGGLQ